MFGLRTDFFLPPEVHDEWSEHLWMDSHYLKKTLCFHLNGCFILQGRAQALGHIKHAPIQVHQHCHIKRDHKICSEYRLAYFGTYVHPSKYHKKTCFVQRIIGNHSEHKENRHCELYWPHYKQKCWSFILENWALADDEAPVLKGCRGTKCKVTTLFDPLSTCTSLGHCAFRI